MHRKVLAVLRPMGRLRGLGLMVAWGAAALVAMSAGDAFATAPTVFDLDGAEDVISGKAEAASLVIGTVIGTLVGIFAAFLVVRVGLRWIRSLLK